MGFVAICTAVYDYKPQSTGELEIDEGELLYILEKSEDDDWWKAKKKAAGDEDDEPEGLIPNNYVQEATPTHSAKALYDYSRQTDEEVSFSEDAPLDVYDTSDPDWTLVGINGDFGFAPANYIELSGATPKSPSASAHRQSLPPVATAQSPTSPASPISTPSGPAADLARVLAGGPASPAAARAISSLPPAAPHQQPTPDASDDEEELPPQLPRRPASGSFSPPAVHPSSYADEAPGVLPSPPYNRAVARPDTDDVPIRSPGGFHLYNINEMVSAMGRRRKMPTTLGINLATGVIMLSPEKSRDGPSQEWTADKMTHYSIEGKHIFIEFVRPSKSLDLHAGAKDTAEEIVSALGEIAGLHRAEGIREVIAAASTPGTHKKGQVLYDFMAQGDDEVTVGVGDEVVVLDDTKSEEWWNVRRLKNGAEGVVPSSYVEITGFTTIEPPSRAGVNAGKSAVEQNRLEEERLAREAARADRARHDADSARTARAEASAIPQRGSSLADETSHRKDRKERDDRKKGRSRPDSSKVRTWTDHSGSFKVEAQFLAVADGKIHLHKVNGVKIAVPVTKMSPEDLAYVEKVTNESIEELIPVADLIKMKRRSQSEQHKSRSGASIDPRGPDQPKAPDYDWFDFFLKAGVGPHQCERYSQAMVRDSMDESVLPDISTDTLRTLGLKEGDALKVMKYLDQRFGRSKGANANGTNGESGFSLAGPNGVLQNNTRRGRPEATRQVSDVVDEDAFKAPESGDKPHPQAKATPLTQAPPREPQGGFEDDAWTVKPSKAAPAPSQPGPAAAPASKPPTGAALDLSLLDAPLVPTPAVQQPPTPQPPAPAPPQPQPQPAVSSAPVQQTQQTGANPQFFSQLPQPTGIQNPQTNISRQRPQAPQSNFTGVGLLPPPPRPTSAPQNPHHNQFGLQPLQPQLTGLPPNSVLQAPPGQSLNDLNQQRLQQQYQQMNLQPQATGFVPQQQGLGQYGMVPQVTGYPPQQQLGQFQQPYINGNAAGSPFADPRPSFQSQPTGIPFQQSPPPAGINSILPPALLPQRTGFTSPLQQSQTNAFQQPYPIQPQQTGFAQPIQLQQTGFQQPIQPQQTGFGQIQANGYGSFQPPPVPPIPQMPTPAPLQPQKTGPAPAVKFGVTEGKKLIPQPTGRRANLANASKYSISIGPVVNNTNQVTGANNPFGF